MQQCFTMSKILIYFAVISTMRSGVSSGPSEADGFGGNTVDNIFGNIMTISILTVIHINLQKVLSPEERDQNSVLVIFKYPSSNEEVRDKIEKVD